MNAGTHRRCCRVVVASIAAAALSAAGCTNDPLRHDVQRVDGKESVYQFLSVGTPAVAKDLLADRWNLGPRFPVVHLAPITWSEDPFGDAYWRFIFYSLRPTSHLLWAYYVSGDTRYRDKLVSILDSYSRYEEAHAGELDRARFGYKHGAGYRALVLVNSYRKLERSGDLPDALAVRLRGALGRLAAFLADETNYEPLHNHGLAEALGLAVIAANFPELAGADGWLALAIARLDALLVTAVDADGVEVENSPFYHFYVLGFSAEIDRWARAYGVPLSPRFSERIDAMLDYATYILQPDGGVPHLGASVDLDAEDLSPAVYEGLAARSPEFAWSYGGGARGTAPAQRARLFPVSGQTTLRSSFGTGPADAPAQTFVTFNVGAWRSPHNHRDVLGLTLYGGGALVLPDSGLFTYDDGPESAYFTGSRAHNVLLVEGADQAITGTVQAGLSASGPSWAYQSGLHALFTGVTMRRGVLVLRRDLVLVLDRADASAATPFAQTWHLPAAYTWSAAGLDVDARDGAGAVRLAIRQALPAGLALAAEKGTASPLQGWISDRYGVREPNWALAYRTSATSAALVTLLATGELAGTSPSVSTRTATDGATVVTACAGAARLEARVADLAGPAEQVVVSVAPEGACP